MNHCWYSLTEELLTISLRRWIAEPRGKKKLYQLYEQKLPLRRDRVDFSIFDNKSINSIFAIEWDADSAVITLQIGATTPGKINSTKCNIRQTYCTGLKKIKTMTYIKGREMVNKGKGNGT